jgi:hypothetical protein
MSSDGNRTCEPLGETIRRIAMQENIKNFPYCTNYIQGITNVEWQERMVWCYENIGTRGVHWNISYGSKGDCWGFKTQEELVEFLLTWT